MWSCLFDEAQNGSMISLCVISSRDLFRAIGAIAPLIPERMIRSVCPPLSLYISKAPGHYVGLPYSYGLMYLHSLAY